MSQPSTSTQRIRAIDSLRGVSVLLMLVAHALIFLSPAHDHDRARGVFNEIDGLPGPTFILTAGFSLALVAARDERDPARRRARRRKSLGRIGQVLFASLVLRHVMWDSFRHPDRWARLDVLTCIALMLLALWIILFVAPAMLRMGLVAALAVACFAAAPWVEAPRTFGPFTPLLNNGPHQDTWPLVPWAGFGFVGALIGRAAGRTTGSTGGSSGGSPGRTIALGFTAMVGVGLLVSGFDPVVHRLDAGVNPWNLTNMGTRLWKIGGVALVLLAAERVGVTLASPIRALIGLFSRQSLIAYVTHLILLFGYWKFRPLNRFLYAVDWPAYVALTMVLIAGTAGVCWVAERRASKLAAKRRLSQRRLSC